MKTILILIILLLGLSSAFASDTYTLDIRVCFPKNKSGRKNAAIGMIASDSISRNIKVNRTNKQTINGYSVFEAMEIIENDQWRRLFVEFKGEKTGLLVYDLGIPKIVRETDWSNWCKPVFRQTGESPDFQVKMQKKDGQEPPPLDAPLISYRVLRTSDYWDYRSGREKDKDTAIPECK